MQAVGRIGQLQAIGLDALRSYLDHRQAAFAQGQGDRLGVQADILEHHRVIMRDQLLPVLAAWFGLAGVIKGEVDARTVAADQPAPLAFVQAMIGEVLVILRRGARQVQLPSGWSADNTQASLVVLLWERMTSWRSELAR